MTREEIYDEIARLRRERESDAPRAMQMDVIRHQDRDFEINDPRTRYSASEIRENALRSALDGRAERRQFDRGSFAPTTPDEAMTATLAPVAETREIVTQGAGLIYWKDRLGIKVTTELGAADPPGTAIQLLSLDGGSLDMFQMIRAEAAHWDGSGPVRLLGS